MQADIFTWNNVAYNMLGVACRKKPPEVKYARPKWMFFFFFFSFEKLQWWMTAYSHNSVLCTNCIKSRTVHETIVSERWMWIAKPLNLNLHPFLRFGEYIRLSSVAQHDVVSYNHSHELKLIDWLCLTFHFECIRHFFVFDLSDGF